MSITRGFRARLLLVLLSVLVLLGWAGGVADGATPMVFGTTPVLATTQQPKSFLDNMKDGTKAASDAQSWAEAGATSWVKFNEEVAEGLEGVNAASDAVTRAQGTLSTIQSAGTWLGRVSKILKVIDYGKLMYQCKDAKTEQEFMTRFNSLVRQGVVDLAGMGAGALGTAGGAALGGGILSPLTGAAGGMAASWAGEKLAGAAYDNWFAEYVQNNYGRRLWAEINGGAPPTGGIDRITTEPPGMFDRWIETLRGYDREIGDNIGQDWWETIKQVWVAPIRLLTPPLPLYTSPWGGTRPSTGTKNPRKASLDREREEVNRLMDSLK